MSAAAPFAVEPADTLRHLPDSWPTKVVLSPLPEELPKVSSSAGPAERLTVTVAPATEIGGSAGAGRSPSDWTVCPPRVMPLVADRPLAVRATSSPEPKDAGRSSCTLVAPLLDGSWKSTSTTVTVPYECLIA